ncbi:pyridoxal phosphate-dependent aminotransferase [Jatrophihabitans lederbergiae]|uniref:Aminotransferase n=1 Tax=Jatrophihabitans lederbergiae TaxID=3075547 RepID=A0ABU2JGI1_9ACTN|nr:aminotransferase class I/II-fold pyridoxal phosphate-dependent enzyme [Jatrophihabitans sp. DSM 44399]MDT0264106.1 aminotransferase class I/II-fold pyridoxal phosphate-dependent enzyme [Jatrophihabitans sp. DSM 44399]
MRVSAAAAGMPSSGIREIMNAAWGRREVIHLEVGQPDFATPAHIIAAAHAAALAGRTGYTPTAGIPELRTALAEKIGARNGFCVDPAQVVLGNGGAQAIYATLVVLTEPGDGILLPDPAWPNFAMMAALLGLDVAHYSLTAAGGYVPDLDELERLVTPRTRVLLLNSPSNPLGSVIDAERMEALFAFAVKHDLWVLSDECYDEITFESPAVSPATFDTDGRVATVYSFSKTYAMTGWRLGYVAAPPAVAEVLANAQEPLISCLHTPTQYAALAALQSAPEVIATMVASYRQRRDTVVGRLTARGIDAFRPAGAFYTWVDVSACGAGSREFALRLLLEEDVAVAPGSAFGAGGDGFVRISLAAHERDLEVGCDRLAALWRRMGDTGEARP